MEGGFDRYWEVGSQVGIPPGRPQVAAQEELLAK